MPNKYYYIICPASTVEQARAKAEEVLGWTNQLALPLSITGLAPVTHYAAHGMFPETEADRSVLPFYFPTTIERLQVFSDANDLQLTFASELVGLKVIQPAGNLHDA